MKGSGSLAPLQKKPPLYHSCWIPSTRMMSNDSGPGGSCHPHGTPLHAAGDGTFGVPATARASFAFYNTLSEIDTLVEGIKKVQEVFQV